MNTNRCFSAQVLSGYAAGTISAVDAETIDEHLSTCRDCLARLDQITRQPDPLVDAIRSLPNSVPQPSALMQAVEAVLSGTNGSGLKAELSAIAGTELCGYRILGELGRGGMGRVYRAAHPRLEQEVALKVLPPGMDSSPILARFEAERQALALMDHPHIARVSDGGVTEHGQPFFVMELVRGIPITRYCEDHQLDSRRRLELFIHVCQAVQHAHQKGVIHRDLKPSNILVAEYDGRATPKIIDFGVARALERAGDGQTEIGMLVGTPEYMSPEQASLSSHGIDTRSDIYALGVILYELLTGDTPVTRQRARTLPVFELLRFIREEDPQPPSMHVSQDSRLRPDSAISRSQWNELDWITLKALDKDRSRRYETAAALADDLRRFLKDEPVLAGPPSNVYRFRKLVRRHKVPALASVLVLLALLGGIAGMTVGLLLANRERAIAEAERDKTRTALTAETLARQQAIRSLHRLTDNVVGRLLGKQLTLSSEDREFLKNIIADYESFAALPGQTDEIRAIRAEAHLRVGTIQERLGENAASQDNLRIARKQFQSLLKDIPDNPNYCAGLATTLNNLANQHRDAGRINEAEAEYRQAQDLCRRLRTQYPAQPDYRRELSTSLLNMGQMFNAETRFEQAATELREGLAIRQQLAAEFPSESNYRRELAQTHIILANALKGLGQMDAAKEEYRKSFTIREQLVRDFPTVPLYRNDLALGRFQLANRLAAEGNLDEAEQEHRLAIATFKQLATEYPLVHIYRSALANSHNNLGILLLDKKKKEEAEAELRAGHVLIKQLADDFPDQPDRFVALGGNYCNLGNMLRKIEKPVESLTMYDRAIEILTPIVEKHSRQAEPRLYLHNSHLARALSLMKLGRFDEAIKDWDRASVLDDGRHRIVINLQRAVCLARVDPPRGVSEVQSLLKAKTIAAEHLYTIATVFALASAHTKEGSDAEKNAAEAINILQQLLAVGYFATPARAELLKNDPDLETIRTRSDFRAILSASDAAQSEARKKAA